MRRGLDARARLALGMAVFGSATPVSKLVTEHLPVFPASAARVALGALVLLPFVAGRLGEARALRRADWLRVAGIAVFGMFGFTAFMLYGMARVPGVVGAIVMSTAPAITAVASMAFLGDSPTRRKLVSIGLAVTGVLVLHVGRGGVGGGEGGGEALLLGSALVLAAVCCEAAYTLLGKRVSDDHDPVLVAFLAAALSLPLFAPFAAWQWPSIDVAATPTSAWLALAWYGAGTLSLGTWLWYSGLRRVEGAVAAAFMGVMPVSALALSYLLLGEPFHWRHLAGFAIVFAGVLLMSREHARMERGEERPSSGPTAHCDSPDAG